jgi:polyribonucleotide nucleotidyltransferase
MLQQPIRKTFDIGGGRMVTIETGRLARQADGAVTVSIGNCMLLATVVANKDPKEGQDFFSIVSRLPGKICFCRTYSGFFL